MSGGACGWIRANFLPLVETIQPQSVLDALVTKGWFRPNNENYQRIRGARTSIEGSRLLLEQILALGEGAAADFREAVSDTYREGEARAWNPSASASLLRNRHAGVLRTDESAPSSPALPTSSQPISPATAANGAAMATNAKIRSALRRRRKNTTKFRLTRFGTGAITGLGVMVMPYLLQWLYQFAMPTREVPIAQPQLQASRRATPAGVYSRNDSSSADLPGVVTNFSKLFLAKAIEDRAYDNAFPWLDEPNEQVEKLHVRLVITTKAASGESTDSRSPFHGLTPAVSIPDQDPTQGTIPVNVSDIFEPSVDHSSVPISRIILRAEAGMGKTFTFAKTMPLRWLRKRNKLWSDIVLLFVVHLGDPDIQKATTYKDIFFSDFPTVDRTMKKGVMNYIRSNPDRVLLVCDAFDEGENFLPDIILRILRGKAFQGLRVLITSRPCPGIQKLAKYSHRQLELLGLAEEDLPDFIRKQLQREANAEMLSQRLEHQLEDRKDMVNLMGSPLVASLVCGLFIRQQYLPGSTTELYERIIMNLLRRAHDKSFPDLLSFEDDYEDKSLVELRGKAGNVILSLSRLALYGTQNRKVVFTIPEVEKLCSKNVLEMGILARLTKTGKTLSRRDHVAFFHLTFMEFFAALALTKPCMDHPPVTFQLNIERIDCVANSLREFPLTAGRDRNIIIWFFAAGHGSFLGRESLHAYDLTGRNLFRQYPVTCSLIKDFLRTGDIDVNKHTEFTWLVTLSVLQLISELHVDAKSRAKGQAKHFPGFCKASSHEILTMLKTLVARKPVLGRLVSTSYWMENESFNVSRENVFFAVIVLLVLGFLVATVLDDVRFHQVTGNIFLRDDTQLDNVQFNYIQLQQLLQIMQQAEN